MDDRRTFRLADATTVEPLIDRWSAWSHLISPVAASMHLVNYQLPALRSYVDDPALHVQSSRDPALAGGRFVDVPVEHADRVRLLLEQTERERAHDVELARAITTFGTWLAREATGQTLETWYDALPAPLRGRVELVYDYRHRASVRCIEPLFYRSEHFRRGSQSLALQHLARDDVRPFFMNTPRVVSSGPAFDWHVAFDDPRVDSLFDLDSHPAPFGAVRELLGATGRDDDVLRALLEPDDGRPEAPPWRGPGARVRYFGHACIVIEWNGVTVMTDPCIGVRPAQHTVPRYSFDDLPARIDYALISHNHQDHFALETLLRLRRRIGQLVVPRSSGQLYGDISLRHAAHQLGFPRVVELDELDSIPLPDGEIVALPFLGEHGDLAHGKTAYVVRAGRERMLFGADLVCLDEQLYRHARAAVGGPIDTLFLATECVGAPLSWSCGPLLPEPPTPRIDRSRRYHGSDARSAMALADAIGARRLYNYGMGLEPWVEYLLGLALPPDAPQMVESERMLAQARGRGFDVAIRPFGRLETVLGGDDRDARSPAETYWPDQLRDADGSLPFVRPASSATAASPVRRTANVPVATVQALQALASRDGRSFEAVLLSLAVSALARQAGREEMLVLAQLAKTGSTEPLPLRIDLSQLSAFPVLLARVDAVLEQARRHGGAVRGSTPACDAVVALDGTGPLPIGTPLVVRLSIEPTGTVQVSLAATPDRVADEVIDALANEITSLAASAVAVPQPAIATGSPDEPDFTF